MAFRHSSWGSSQNITQKASTILECVEPSVNIGNHHLNNAEIYEQRSMLTALTKVNQRVKDTLTQIWAFLQCLEQESEELGVVQLILYLGSCPIGHNDHHLLYFFIAALLLPQPTGHFLKVGLSEVPKTKLHAMVVKCRDAA